MSNPKLLKGWRYGVFITGFVGFLGLAIYPIIIDPMINTEKYKKIQEINRRDIKQEDVQPGNMKIWSNPYENKK